MLVAPAHTVEIGGAQAKLALAFLDKEPVGELLHQPLDDVGSAVGRVVLDNKHVELLLERENFADNLFYILFFVVCRCNNKRVCHK